MHPQVPLRAKHHPWEIKDDVFRASCAGNLRSYLQSLSNRELIRVYQTVHDAASNGLYWAQTDRGEVEQVMLARMDAAPSAAREAP